MSGRKNMAEGPEEKGQSDNTREIEEEKYLKVGSQSNCHP